MTTDQLVRLLAGTVTLLGVASVFAANGWTDVGDPDCSFNLPEAGGWGGVCNNGLDDDGDNTKGLSREHTVLVSRSNLVTVTGGKWTTYRKMAEDAVNNAIFVGKLIHTKCVTKDLKIIKEENKNEIIFLFSTYAASKARITSYLVRFVTFNVRVRG